MSIISPSPPRIDEAFVVRSVRHSLSFDHRVVSDVAAALIDVAAAIPEAERRTVAAAIRAELKAAPDRTNAAGPRQSHRAAAGNANDWRDAADTLDPQL